MSEKLHLLGIGLIGVFAILVMRVADFVRMPEMLTFTPLEIVAVVVATLAVLVIGRIFV